MSLDLRPSMLDDLGLLQTLSWHFERYTAQTGVRVKFRHAGLERRFGPEVEITAYRVVQEALTNVARYAGVTEAYVELVAEGKNLTVRIVDQGVGFEPDRVACGKTAGLSGLNERLALLNGELTIESEPGIRTCLTARIPLKGRGK
jgi:signal transduction histidine kinase